MHTHIELITPIITEGLRTLDEVRPFERPDLTITQSLIRQGPASIESEFDEALAVPDALVKTSLAHSKRTWPAPGRKRIAGFEIPGFNAD